MIFNPNVPTALIDADIICYAAAASAQTTVDFDDGEGPVQIVNIERARDQADAMIRDYKKMARCKDIRLCLTDRSHSKATFRYQLLPSYKGQRPNLKPECHDELLDDLKNRYPWIIYPGLEGDDVIGVIATGEGRRRCHVISIDKDMRTIPCQLWVPGKGQERPKIISPEEADRNWMLQTLVGDATDNYKGCVGIGPVKARRALLGACTLEEQLHRVVQTIREKMHMGETKARDYAIQQARLARILRFEDYDSGAGRVRLWHPDQPEWIDAVSKN